MNDTCVWNPEILAGSRAVQGNCQWFWARPWQRKPLPDVFGAWLIARVYLETPRAAAGLSPFVSRATLWPSTRMALSFSARGNKRFISDRDNRAKAGLRQSLRGQERNRHGRWRVAVHRPTASDCPARTRETRDARVEATSVFGLLLREEVWIQLPHRARDCFRSQLALRREQPRSCGVPRNNSNLRCANDQAAKATRTRRMVDKGSDKMLHAVVYDSRPSHPASCGRS